MRDLKILPDENDLGMARLGIAPKDIEENACFGTFQYDQIDSNPKYQLRKDKFLVPILLWGPNNQVRNFSNFSICVNESA